MRLRLLFVLAMLLPSVAGATSGGYGAPIATLQGNGTTYIAAGLQAGTTYFFVITSYDSAGNESSRSNEVSKSVF